MHPAIVGERLGHSSIAITIDLYSHVMSSMQRNATDLGGSSIVIVDGLSKPRRAAAADPKDYRRAVKMRAEFAARRTVLA